MFPRLGEGVVFWNNGTSPRAFTPQSGVVRAAVLAALLILLATCQVDKLTNTPPPVATLRVGPRTLRDSAAVGSAALRWDTVAVSNAGQGALSWHAQLQLGGQWLTVGSSDGIAPAKLQLSFRPTGLATGLYRDTLVVSGTNADSSPARIPIEFVVHPCVPVSVVPDAQLADSLTTRDCSAPHRATSFARLFSFTAKAGDSVAIVMSSPTLDAYVVLDTSLAPGAPPLAQNDNCGSVVDACLPYQKLPVAGTYVIEAAAGAGQTGTFTLTVTRPRSPTGLGQFQSDGTTPIPRGGTATSSSVVFKATVSDPSLGSQLRLDVEVEPLGTPFANVASGSGFAVANGSIAIAAVAGLSANTAYHWQARAVDQSGRSGLWGSFGANAATEPDFRLAGVATQLALNGGDNQTATAGTSVPIAPSVIVTDAGGHPVPGVAVSFAVAGGGGNITGASQTTTAGGIATVGGWTLGAVAGSNTLTASSGTLAGSPVTFTATGTAGNAGSIALNAGNNQTVTVNTPVVTAPSVIVKDVNGNGVSGVAVTFAVASGGGSITGAVQATNASGIATVGSWTLGTVAGANTLRATATGLNGSPVTFSATGTAGAPNAGRSLISATPGTITASTGASAATITVTVSDQFGNPVSGASVLFAAAPSTGTALTQPATTNGNGQTSGTLSSTKAGTKTVSATVNGTTVVTATATVTVNPGPASIIAINGGNNQTVTAGTGVPNAPSVLVTDANANPVAGVPVTFAVASGGGSITGASQTSTAAGIATVGGWTLGTTAGPNTLTATSGTLTGSPVTFAATGTAGNAGSIAANAGTSQTATVSTAVAIRPAVIVKDVNGNPVAGVAVMFASTPRSGSVAGASQTTGADGIATVGSWTLGTVAGLDTLTATATGVNGSPVPFVAAGTADAPSASRSSVSAAPGTIAASSGDVASTITVTAVDQFGNPVPGKTVVLAASPTTGATVTQPTAVTDGNGVATGAVSSTKAETKTVSATIAGVAVAQQPAITVTPAAATNLNFVVEPPASTTAGATITPAVQVEVRDAFNNRVTSATNAPPVTLALGTNPSGGTLTGGTPPVAPVSGVVTFGGLSIDKAGTGYTLTAANPNLTGATSTAFNIATGAATTIALNAGNAQTDTIGATLATPYSVKVTDANGNPVGGITVTWSVTTGGGSITPSSVTPPSGIATATRVLGTTAGPQGATATVSGLTGSPVTFTATATPGTATTMALNAGNSQSDTIGATLSVPYGVLVTDRAANPVGGITVAWAVPSGGGSIPASSVTSAAGIATAARVLGTTAGPQSASATVAGLTGSPVGFTATATHGHATTIALNGGNAQTGAVNSTLLVAYSVLVTDRGGNPVTGTTVTWAVSGGGSITPSSVTAATGIATATRVLGPVAGPQGATATVTGLTGSPVSFTATATASGATQLVTTTQPAASAASGAALSPQPVVQLQDGNGNNVAQAGTLVTATVAVGPAGATLANATATTGANGAATFTGLAISGSVGSYRLQMASGTLKPDTTVAITLNPGAAAKLALTTQPSASVQNAIAFPQQPVVQLQDASGNNVAQAGVGVTPAIATGGGTLSPTTAVVTNGSGAALFSGLTLTGTTGARTLTFTSGSLTAVTSAPVTVTAGTATQIAVSSGDNQTATAGTAVATPPAVIVRDVSGNPVAGSAVTFAVSGTSNGAITGANQTTAATGIAQVASWTLGTVAKPDTLTATALGLTGSPITFVDTAKVGAPASMAKFSGDNLTGQVGTPLATPHDVLITDANGNPVGGVTVTWAAATGGGSVSPTTSVTNAGGHAQTTRTLGPVPGTQTTTASATGLTTVTFTVTAQVGGATQMAINAGNSQTDTVGQTLPTAISVVVRDALNNPVSGVTVGWSVLGGGGSVSAPSSVTDAGGIASINWTLGTRRTATDSVQTAQATSVGSPVQFVAYGVPGGVSATHTTVVAAPATITVSGGSSVSTITVTALDQFDNPIKGKTVTLAAAPTAGNTLTQPAAATDANGVATGSLSSTTAGTKTVSATVATVAITQQATLTVNAAATTTAITGHTPNPSAVGEGIAITFTVTSTGGTPTGNVTVSDGAATCTGAVAAGTCTLTPTTAGAKTLTASYAGDANFAGSTSAGVAQTVNAAATTTTIAGQTPNPSAVGQAVSFTFTVVTNAPGSGTPTGTVTVSDGTQSCAATVAVGSCSTTFSSAGGRSVTASYAGDGNFAASTSVAVTQTVGAASTTTAITGHTPNPSAVGQGITVTFTVTSSGGTPTGNVTVSDGAASCVGTVTAGTCTLAPTTAGAKTLTATYAGDGNFAGSTSDGVAQTVSAASTTTAITDHTPNPSAVGEGIAVTFTVTSTGGTPTGNVTVSDGTASCTGTVAAGTCTVTPTTSGAKTLTATYAGDGNFAGSTSTGVAHTVNAAATTTAITGEAPNPSVVGQAVGFTFTVVANAPGSGTPTGTVTVSDGTQSCSATVAVGTCSIPFSTAGVRSVTAAYGGDGNYAASTSAAGTQTVTAAATTTTITGHTPDPSVLNQPITVTFSVAAIAPGAGTPTGNVTVADGTGDTCAGTVAAGTCTLTPVTAGPKSLVATYAGDADYATSASTPLTHTVNVAGTPSSSRSSMSASPSPITASNGASLSTITVTVLDAFGNAVSGATVSLTATPVTGNTLTQPVGTTDANGQITGTLASTKAEVKTVSATVNGSVPVTQTAAVTVDPGAATQLTFTQQPSNVVLGSVIGSVVVTAWDQFANVATGFTSDVTMTIATDASVLKNATLGGTTLVAAVAGSATFSDLTIDQLGVGYTLGASQGGLTGAISNPFDVVTVLP